MKETMNKFRRRLVKNAVLRSLIAAFMIASGVLFVTALASWIFDFKAGIWLAVGLFVGSFAGGAALFYILKFRPSARDVARSIDSLGLEERIITMMELEGDDSYIAQVQRADAQAALAKADHTLLKIAVSVSLIVAVSVAAVFGVGALTVDSLYTAGVIPSGVKLAAGAELKREFSVKYTVPKEGGKVYYWENFSMGEEVSDALTVLEGEDAPAVIVVPDEGYCFVGWSDGVYDPYRQEKEVSRNLSVNAMFEEIEEVEDLVDDEDLPEDGEGDGLPGSPPNNNGQNQGGNMPMPGGEGAAGSHSAENQQVNDGQTFYGDVYKDAYSNAMDNLGSGSNIPGDLQGGIVDYLESIGKDGSNEGSEGGEGSETDPGSDGD